MLGSIVISNNCNLDCSYCSITNKNTSPILSFEQILEFIKSNLEKNDQIEFYGGEPTIHMDLITKVMDKYPENPYILYTNGLFDNNFINQYEQYFSKFRLIMISLDGITEKSNRFRKLNDSDISKVLTSYDLIKNINPNTIIGCALSNKESFDNLFGFFSYLVTNHNCHGMSFEAVTVVNDDKIRIITPESLFKLLQTVYSAISLNLAGYPFYISLPREFLSPEFYFKIFGKENCSNNVISISPRGNIYHCREHAANEEGLLVHGKFNGIPIVSSSSSVLHLQNIDYLKGIEEFCSCHVKGDQIGKEVYSDIFFIKDKTIQEFILYPIFNWIMLTKKFISEGGKDILEDKQLTDLLNKTLLVLQFGIKYLKDYYL